jgi:hypothetical protein
LSAMSVRLQSADEFYSICGCTVDPLNGACIEMDVVRTYWEGCVVPGRATAAPDQIDREQIECRPKIVDAVPQDRSPFFWNGNIQPEAVNYVRGGRFVLGNDAIRMELKGIDGRFEVRKMFFGPVDFYAASEQGIGQPRHHVATFPRRHVTALSRSHAGTFYAGT